MTTTDDGLEARAARTVELSDADRAAALAAGAPRVPRRVVVIGVAVAALLALGGSALERLASSAGLNPSPSTTLPAPRTQPGSQPGTQLGSTMASFLGLVRLAPRPAPPISLMDQAGRIESLAQLRGKVVVLTFFNASCSDACRVLATELAGADARLGPARARVAIVTVNTDPLETSWSPPPSAVRATGLGRLGNWLFLTAALPVLDDVWRNYGVAIRVYPDTGLVTHNNVMYFIDPDGRLRLRTQPIADESPAGSFSLPAPSVSRSAKGIADFAAGLLVASR